MHEKTWGLGLVKEIFSSTTLVIYLTVPATLDRHNLYRYLQQYLTRATGEALSVPKHKKYLLETKG